MIPASSASSCVAAVESRLTARSARVFAVAACRSALASIVRGSGAAGGSPSETACLTRDYPVASCFGAPGLRLDKHLERWQEWRDSNPRPSVLETDALPTELHSCGRGRLYLSTTGLASEGQGRMG